MWKGRVVWPGLDCYRRVGIDSAMNSFLVERINVLKAWNSSYLRAFLKPVMDRHPWKNNFLYANVCFSWILTWFSIQEFQFLLAGRCFGNRSKRIVQISWLSLYINLRREQIDGSKGQRAYLFVNGRKEFVKFGRINCFASLFGIIRNLPYWRFTTPYRWISLLVLSFNRSVFCQWIRFVFNRTVSLFNYEPFTLRKTILLWLCCPVVG